MARNKFDVDEELESTFDLDQLKRMMGYLRPFKMKIFFTVFLMLLASGAALTGPYLIKVAIDDKIPNGDAGGLRCLPDFI